MLSLIFYTNWFIPARFAAMTYGPVVFMRPKYEGDEGLKQHEMTHVKQFWRNPLFGLAYWLSKSARLKYEAAAYKVQLQYYPDDRLDTFATLLSTNYNLGITKEEARQAILAQPL